MRVPFPIFKSELVAITIEPSIVVSDWQSLMPYKVIAPGSFRLIWKRLENHKNTHRASDSLDALKKLINRDVDVAIVNKYEAQRLMVVYGAESYVIQMPPLETHDIYHFVHKRNSHLIPALTNALKEMEEDGFLERTWMEHGASN